MTSSALRTGVWCGLVVLGLAACLEARLVPCGDQLCPVGTTCVADALCANAEQLEACAGIADGATCTVGGGVGHCDRGVCSAGGCGNGAVDPDEACDDGNATSGDGCRADCRKVEACGDAVVDDGEGCDDGNVNAADGCDACVPTSWRATAVIGGTAQATGVGLAAPGHVAVERGGNLYVVETGRIRRVDATGVITTVAGTGVPGYAGDGGVATSAQIAATRIAVDGLGNLYLAETSSHRIRRVGVNGIITTVAGTGIPGTSGDGGAATSALIAAPRAVAVDGLGVLYIADGNARVRRVGTSGVITTVAGGGTNVGDGGAAISAQLCDPADVAVDDHGDLFIADSCAARIRRVDASGIITTVAGNGVAGFAGDGGAATSAQLASPRGLAIDELGNLYVADTLNSRIRRVDASGLITTVAGGGSGGDGGAATDARLATAVSVAADTVGNVYIADKDAHRVRRVDPTGIITTIAGNGSPGSNGDGGAATSVRFGAVAGLAVDGPGNLYIADQDDRRVRRVDASGVITTVAGTGAAGHGGDGGPAVDAQVVGPQGLAVDGAGNLYIADPFDHRIRRVDASGIIATVAGNGTAGYSGDGGAATSAQLDNPRGVAVDGLGDLYFVDSSNHCVRRVDATGVITTVAGTGVAGYTGDGGAATAAQLDSPRALAFDGQGQLYIADTGGARIRRVDAAGVITTVAGTGTAGHTGDGGPAIDARIGAEDVAIDDLGNLYLASMFSARIRRVDPAGIITTVAGNGTFGDAGDGGAATDAALPNPSAVAVDGAGNLYAAGAFGDRRVRRVDPAGQISTVAGWIDPVGMGPRAQARLADPRAFVRTASFTLFAGGSTGTIQAARSTLVEVAAGRYPLASAGSSLARFRADFGAVAGVAYDEANGLIYLSESTSHRLHVITVVDAADENTWTIAPLANAGGTAGFADGAAATARFRNPTGLYLDAAARQLYVADTGNHVVRAIDLSAGVATATVRSVAGLPATRGYYGDGGAATAALLYAPQAVTRCPNGDLFIADTGNHRVRRVAAGTSAISTVLGDGVPASSGEGAPASSFPVDTPLGLACDATGNVFVTSTTAVRLVPADASGVVDGTGGVQTIYGAPPRDAFPASVTACLTGVGVVDATTLQVVDSCTGMLVELRRELAP